MMAMFGIKQGRVLSYCINEAQVLSRPTVIGDEQEGYHLWFSYRGDAISRHHVGYAYSENACELDLRLGELEIDVSSSGINFPLGGSRLLVARKV